MSTSASSSFFSSLAILNYFEDIYLVWQVQLMRQLEQGQLLLVQQLQQQLLVQMKWQRGVLQYFSLVEPLRTLMASMVRHCYHLP